MKKRESGPVGARSQADKGKGAGAVERRPASQAGQGNEVKTRYSATCLLHAYEEKKSAGERWRVSVAQIISADENAENFKRFLERYALAVQRAAILKDNAGPVTLEDLKQYAEAADISWLSFRRNEFECSFNTGEWLEVAGSAIVFGHKIR